MKPSPRELVSIIGRMDPLPGDYLFPRLARAVQDSEVLPSGNATEDRAVMMRRYAHWAQTAADHVDEAVNEFVRRQDADAGLRKLHAVALSLRLFALAQRGLSGAADGASSDSPHHRSIEMIGENIADLPQELKPSQIEFIELSSGRIVPVPKCCPRFEHATDFAPASLAKTLRSKPLCMFDGESVFVELGIARLFERAGWRAAWADTFHRAFRRQMPPAPAMASLPPTIQPLCDRLRVRTDRAGGCWDVVAWHDERVLFIEAKHNQKDRLRAGQKEWLNAALGEGLSTTSFLIVEWDWR